MAESITSEQNSIVFSYYFSVVVVSNKIFEKILVFRSSIMPTAKRQTDTFKEKGKERSRRRRGS